MNRLHPRWSLGSTALLVPLLATLVLVRVTPAAAEPSGQELFLKYQCNKCHTIRSLEIGKLESAASEDEDEESDATAGKKRPDPPDLSGEGLGEHDAAFLEAFLMRREKIEGRSHRQRFRGKPAELDAVVEWLLTLKTPPAEATP